MKTIAEQIAAFEASRAAKDARMAEIMQKAAESGETLDDATSEEYDTLDGEIKKIDEHLTRLAAAEKRNKAAAKPVDNVDTIERASDARGGNGSTSQRISVKANVPPATAFTRYAMAIAQSGQSLGGDELRQAVARPDAGGRLALSIDVAPMLKAAVAPQRSTWASPLVAFRVMASSSSSCCVRRPSSADSGLRRCLQYPDTIHDDQFDRRMVGETRRSLSDMACRP